MENTKKAQYYYLFSGAVLAGTVYADEAETLRHKTEDAYNKTIGTQFRRDGETLCTVWSDGLSWRTNLA